MKEFNLQEYLANPSQKIMTRDGRKVRILCTNAKNEFPIIALISNDNKEVLMDYNNNGKVSLDEITDFDLFFAPTKREGYINIYCNIYYEGSDKDRNTGKNIFSSEEEAKEHKDLGYITTIKIKWEE